MRWWAIKCALLACLMGLSVSVAAHPEDEFCTPGEDGMDPALCLALRELDRPGEVATTTPTVELARSTGETFWTYTTIGVRHILPGGFDHILFVMAFFLSTTRLRPLLWQIGAFTVAHTVTLGLAASGMITPPSAIVESFIALSIAWVAFENLTGGEVSRGRTALVFAFGLVHGMGFAGFFGELGLPPGQFFSALIGFNVGVEIGQLVIIAAMLALSWRWRSQAATEEGAQRYRAKVVVPASIVIGLIAMFWFLQRSFGALYPVA